MEKIKFRAVRRNRVSFEEKCSKFRVNKLGLENVGNPVIQDRQANGRASPKRIWSQAELVPSGAGKQKANFDLKAISSGMICHGFVL